MNLYGYVMQDPVSHVDLLGLGPWDRLYGFPKEFWRWFHKDDPKLFKQLKDPKTGQIPKEVVQPYYDAWQKEKGFVDPLFLEALLIPWFLTPSELEPGTLWGPGTPYTSYEDYYQDNNRLVCP